MNTIEIRFKHFEIDNEDGSLFALSLDGRIYNYNMETKTWTLIPGPSVEKIPGFRNGVRKTVNKRRFSNNYEVNV